MRDNAVAMAATQQENIRVAGTKGDPVTHEGPTDDNTGGLGQCHVHRQPATTKTGKHKAEENIWCCPHQYDPDSWTILVT